MSASASEKKAEKTTMRPNLISFERMMKSTTIDDSGRTDATTVAVRLIVAVRRDSLYRKMPSPSSGDSGVWQGI